MEIRDASICRVKAPETSEIIKQELNEPKAQVASIALAKNRYISLLSTRSAQPWRPEPRYGDKKLKAIAVRGTKDINIANPEEFINCVAVLQVYTMAGR